jgi:hypothetical protein
MRASEPFHRATEHIVAELRRAGLTEVEVLRFPADGTTMFGTQKSRPAWDAEFAELWELESRDQQWQPGRRIASWESMPLSLAQDSDSGEVTADLIDVGAGTKEQDYAGKQVRGQLVLTSSQPEAVAPLAVDRLGAAGIVSYAQNQPTAWSREDESLVRWGHLDSFSPRRTFGFMVSLKQARSFQARLNAGETVRLQATVKAQRHPGEYEIVSATIAGADPALAQQQIAFTCHLDHPRPGANDNASGCATILEVARTYAHLIAQGKLARPRRTLHFFWPPEADHRRHPHGHGWRRRAHQSRLSCNALAGQPAEFRQRRGRGVRGVRQCRERCVRSRSQRALSHDCLERRQAGTTRADQGIRCGQRSRSVHRQLVPHPDHLYE